MRFIRLAPGTSPRPDPKPSPPPHPLREREETLLDAARAMLHALSGNALGFGVILAAMNRLAAAVRAAEAKDTEVRS